MNIRGGSSSKGKETTRSSVQDNSVDLTISDDEESIPRKSLIIKPVIKTTYTAKAMQIEPQDPESKKLSKGRNSYAPVPPKDPNKFRNTNENGQNGARGSNKESTARIFEQAMSNTGTQPHSRKTASLSFNKNGITDGKGPVPRQTNNSLSTIDQYPHHSAKQIASTSTLNPSNSKPSASMPSKPQSLRSTDNRYASRKGEESIQVKIKGKGKNYVASSYEDIDDPVEETSASDQETQAIPKSRNKSASHAPQKFLDIKSEKSIPRRDTRNGGKGENGGNDVESDDPLIILPDKPAESRGKPLHGNVKAKVEVYEFNKGKGKEKGKEKNDPIIDVPVKYLQLWANQDSLSSKFTSSESLQIVLNTKGYPCVTISDSRKDNGEIRITRKDCVGFTYPEEISINTLIKFRLTPQKLRELYETLHPGLKMPEEFFKKDSNNYLIIYFNWQKAEDNLGKFIGAMKKWKELGSSKEFLVTAAPIVEQSINCREFNSLYEAMHRKKPQNSTTPLAGNSKPSLLKGRQVNVPTTSKLTPTTFAPSSVAPQPKKPKANADADYREDETNVKRFYATETETRSKQANKKSTSKQSTLAFESAVLADPPAPLIPLIPPPEKPNEILLVWPPNNPGGVSITAGDMHRLSEGEYLNDTLIELGLKQMLEKLQATDPELASKIHIFNSFFYKKLTAKPIKSEKKSDAKSKDSTAPPMDSYSSVRRWTSKIDLFAKQYIIIPINEHFHWYLAIIVNPAAVLRVSEAPIDVKTGRTRLSNGIQTPSAMMDQPMEAIESCGPKLIPNEAELPVEANETSLHFEENRKEKLENGNVVDENEALNLAGMEDQMESVELDDPETDVAAAKTGKSLVEHGSSVEPEAGPSLMQVDAPIVSIEAGMDLDSPSNGTVVVPSNETIVQVPDLGQLLFPAAPPSTIDRLIEEECQIFVFDSLGSTHASVINKLKEYLKKEAADKKQKPADDTKAKGKNVKVPQQPNSADCGLYLLHFTERFFTNEIGGPIGMSKFIMKNKSPSKNHAETVAELNLNWDQTAAAQKRATFREKLSIESKQWLVENEPNLKEIEEKKRRKETRVKDLNAQDKDQSSRESSKARKIEDGNDSELEKGMQLEDQASNLESKDLESINEATSAYKARTDAYANEIDSKYLAATAPSNPRTGKRVEEIVIDSDSDDEDDDDAPKSVGGPSALPAALAGPQPELPPSQVVAAASISPNPAPESSTKAPQSSGPPASQFIDRAPRIDFPLVPHVPDSTIASTDAVNRSSSLSPFRSSPKPSGHFVNLRSVIGSKSGSKVEIVQSQSQSDGKDGTEVNFQPRYVPLKVGNGKSSEVVKSGRGSSVEAKNGSPDDSRSGSGASGGEEEVEQRLIQGPNSRKSSASVTRLSSPAIDDSFDRPPILPPTADLKRKPSNSELREQGMEQPAAKDSAADNDSDIEILDSPGANILEKNHQRKKLRIEKEMNGDGSRGNGNSEKSNSNGSNKSRGGAER